MPDLVAIKTFAYRHEAELAKNLLAEEGIESVVSADDLGSHRPHLLFTGGKGGMAKLLVRKEDVQEAERILAVLEEPREED
jgi:hypothetical protein